MWELYFGSSRMSCDAAVLSASRHEMETFIGAVPAQCLGARGRFDVDYGVVEAAQKRVTVSLHR